MTFTLKSETINGYEVEIRQEGFNSWYAVYIFSQYGTTYRKSNPQPDMARAKATYRRYRKEIQGLA